MRTLPYLVGCVLTMTCVIAVRAEEPQAEVPEDVLAASEANTQFTFDLYRHLAAENGDNLFLSGYSVTSAFMMLAEGAVGPAAGEVGETFHLPRTHWSGDAEHPWRFSDFSQGCAGLERRMLPGDAAHTAEIRAQLTELETRWERLQRDVANARGNAQFDLMRQERELVAQINALRQQIDPYQLRFANAVWCDTGFPLRDDFLSRVDASWGALAFASDFRSNPDGERENINSWVSDQTNGLIPDLLPPMSVDEMTKLVLTNAVYFKGSWEEPFQEASTQEQPFFLASGAEVAAMLMSDWHRDSRYVELTPEGEVNDYLQVDGPTDSPFDDEWQLPENPDGFKLIELPYRGESMSMVVVLPNSADGLDEIEAALTREAFTEWQSKMSSQEVNVFLPKFTMRNTLDLTLPMRELGLEGIFQEGGLTGFSDHPDAERLIVTTVIQQAFVDVNEEGTEAAAATAIVFAPTSAAPSVQKPTPEFRADHPFLYFIQHRETGAIVFMGRMTTPE